MTRTEELHGLINVLSDDTLIQAHLHAKARALTILEELESSSRPDMLTEEGIERLAVDAHAERTHTDDPNDDPAKEYGEGYRAALRYARDRFSAPPAIDVEKIMEVVSAYRKDIGYSVWNMSDEEWYAGLRSRLLSLLSPGKGEGVTVAEPTVPLSAVSQAKKPEDAASIADAPSHQDPSQR